MDERDIIYTIFEYEESVNMPVNERRTYLNSNSFPRLKPAIGRAIEYEAYAGKCRKWLEFGGDVDEVIAGAYEPHDMLKVCDTTEIFIKAGFKQKPMLYTQHHLEMAMQPKTSENLHCHGLSVGQIKRLPELLESPVLLADSPSKKDVLLAVLCETDSDKLPLITAIKPDGNGTYELRRIETNIILSVYGKDNFEKYFENLLPNRMIVYFNKEKAQKLERLSGIRFSGCYSNLEPNKILRRPSCVVNEELSKQQEGQKLIARLQEIGFSSNAELYMPYVFEYQGYHFVPAGALPADWTRDKMNKIMRTHLLMGQEPHLSTYDKSVPGRENDISYSLLDFYKASGLSQADVFKCIETGKTYIPGENELFGYTGEYIEVVPDPIDTSVRYGIYVINDATPSREYRFMGMDYLEKNGVVVQPQDYSLVYRGELWSDGTLDSLYTRFNTDPPKDYAGPSMSVSDVIVVQKGDNAKAYFVDRIGFKELPDFVEQRPQGELSRELGMVLDEPAAERKDIVLNGASRSSRSRDDVSL